jgi:hypothetical protein
MSLADQQKGRVADEIATFGAAAHRAADKFDEQDDHNIAGYIHAAGEQLDRIADYVRDKNLNQLLDDAGQLAQRRPELFFGGMFVAGLALARFLKASGRSSRRAAALGTEMHREPTSNVETQHVASSPMMETQPCDLTGGRGFQETLPSPGPEEFSTDTGPAPNISAGSVITAENTLRPAERAPLTLSEQDSTIRSADSSLVDSTGEAVSTSPQEGSHCRSEAPVSDEDRPTCC